MDEDRIDMARRLAKQCVLVCDWFLFAYAERNRSPFASSLVIDEVILLIIPAAELLFVEKTNLKYELFTVDADNE